ncbi:hypothetical protein HGB38_01610 [Nocardia gamkensis]|uniref:HTH-like domain-containing protein n=1 Tax=Nocardia gamkensis TaxID=352869 RepID=A0A7X6R137_9NOCA|nr:hypothetical protein [Nocardia gamkensis]
MRKLWRAACRAGHNLGRDQVARLMRLAGIDGVVRGRRTTITTERDRDRPARHPDLAGAACRIAHRVRCGRDRGCSSCDRSGLRAGWRSGNRVHRSGSTPRDGPDPSTTCTAALRQ